MRNAIRNGLAAALAATVAFAGITPAHAEDANASAPEALAFVDSDNDGLPDLWEQNGVILTDGTEVPLPGYGVDVNRPDMFVQLNWMASEYRSAGCEDNYTPACDSLDKRELGPSVDMLEDLVDLFDEHGINLHIDAGEFYTNIPNYDNPQGGETLDYARYYFENEVQGFKLLNDIDDMLGERDNIFRLGLIGDQIDDANYASGVSLVGDNAFFVANNKMMQSDENLRNTILHELGHTLDLRHWGADDAVGELISKAALPMNPAYQSVMNYKYQFSNFNYSEDAYELNTPHGSVVVPADWEALKINTDRIGAEAQAIGNFAAMAGKVPARIKRVKPAEKAPAKVEEQDEAPAKVEEQVEAPAEDKAEAPAKVEDKVEDDAPVKVDLKVNEAKQDNIKQLDKAPQADVNIIAIVAPIVAVLAIVGIGIGFAGMMF